MNFFTADLHFDHKGLIEKMGRALPDLETANSTILDGINRTAGRRDRLFILGDLGFNLARWRQKMVCKNCWVCIGNHDKPAQLQAVFGKNNVRQVIATKIRNVPTWLSHYPHAFWPKSHHGAMHLYGHCHSNRETTLDILWPRRRSMDCGVDNAFKLLGEWRPFSEDEIYERLMARSGHDLLEFYRGAA